MTGVFELCSEITDRLAAMWPTDATLAGVPGHDHEWNDYRPEARERMAAEQRRLRDRVAALPMSDDRWESLAARVAVDWLDQEIADHARGEHLRDVNSIESPAQVVREIFEIMDTDSTEGWAAIATRLEGLPDVLAGYRDALDEGRRRGLVAARRQVDAVVTHCRGEAAEGAYFAGLPREAEDGGVADAALVGRIAAAEAGARAAFGELADYLERDYRPHAETRDGVGEERHRHFVRRFLGGDIDPEETYHWGWDEVDVLRAEMIRVADEISPGATPAAALQILKSDPARLAASREDFIATMKDRQALALAELDGTHFDVPAEIRSIDVRISPPRESLGAYYVQPSEDFSRPGCVWYSLGSDDTVALYDEVSTAYHEGFPGHHLQCGIQVALGDRLSRMHRLIVWYSGYGEGWALYAERLMHELGYLEKPDYVFGLLAAQMLRTCRVVVDIGSHLGYPIPEGQPFHPGEQWTFETAVEMLADYATLDLPYARSEVTRYLGWPAQAISYKVGERTILHLRDEMRRRQGDGFDLKEFHRRVLETGPVGLDLLQERVLNT